MRGRDRRSVGSGEKVWGISAVERCDAKEGHGSFGEGHLKSDGTVSFATGGGEALKVWSGWTGLNWHCSRGKVQLQLQLQIPIPSVLMGRACSTKEGSVSTKGQDAAWVR